MSTAIAEIDANTLKKSLGGEHPPLVIDVREAWEVAQGALPDAVHIPLAVLTSAEGQPAELFGDMGRSIVTYCHHGVRSMRAAQALEAMGYTDVASLRGGIDAWAVQVDSSVGRY